MPNQYKNKVVVDGTTLIDLTADTVTAAALMQGYTAHDASGAPIVGTSTAGTMVIRDTQDSHGGTVREITAGSVVTGTKTITANGAYDVAEYAEANVNVPSAEPELQAKTATPTESQQTVTPDSGYDGLSSVTVEAVSGTYVGSGIMRRSSTDLTASGATVTVPSGYYSAQASKAVSSGTAGTPTATKGTVSNHSVSVTPSVTNTTGYITGGTKTGTAVTVSASELVSGSQTITENGTVDVTNLASVDVDVQASGGSSYTLVYSTTLEVSTTSTTAVEVATIETGDTSIWTSDKLAYVKIRDAAGWRNGYFYGMDAFLANNSPTIGATSSYAWFGRGYSMASNNRYPMPMLASSTSVASAPQGYGVYPTFLYNDGSIKIMARYSSSSATITRTIDGTFSVDVYLLDWPDGISPYLV